MNVITKSLSADLGNGMYLNPVLRGNYADPSIVRVGTDYYMTHTSYHALPGLIIWHSKDLIHWNPIGAALHENVGDVWAPEFIYYNGLFYIYFPANRTNWVITAPTPEGPWSRPIDLKIKGIDPGHLVTPEGERYLVMSGGELVRLADDGLSVIGEPQHVYDGWKYPEEWEVEAYSLEGPKITYRDGYYYLTVAVGGTAGPATGHMVVSSRAVSPFGPWEHSPYNPIVRAASKKDRWWSKGHGTLVDTPEGGWWMVYHAYEKGLHTLGRVTMLEPVEWTPDGWFTIQPGIASHLSIAKPPGAAGPHGWPAEDGLRGGELGLLWQCSGHLPQKRFHPGAEGLSGDGRTEGSPLLYMAGHESYEVQVKVTAQGDAEGRLMLYYNDAHYLGIGASSRGVRHFRSFKNYGAMPCGESSVYLKIRNRENTVSFYFSPDGTAWRKYDKVVEASGLHHNTLGGFLSLRIGLDAAGEGNVTFTDFVYKPL
ncbi:family 43 glycosylhydrolase [Paenibacillus sp. S-38]|uniref:family 43 glycosylhydrolase n=1 Tax=Paenibacillus sp. S-38 TaxID=3416710 RepID=UPI003CF88808